MRELQASGRNASLNSAFDDAFAAAADTSGDTLPYEAFLNSSRRQAQQARSKSYSSAAYRTASDAGNLEIELEQRDVIDGSVVATKRCRQRCLRACRSRCPGCCRRIPGFNDSLHKYGLLFADEAMEHEYELDFMRSERNYKFLGVAGGIMTLYTIYLMSWPLVGRLDSLQKYSAIFEDPANNELPFSVHSVLHGVLQLGMQGCLVTLSLLKSNVKRLRLLRFLPVVALLWLISLTLLFVEVELTNLWDWQSGLANITIGNINTSTFTTDVTVKSCATNMTNGYRTRLDGCSYNFELMTKFALIYGWVSGSTNSELFIANIWVRCRVSVSWDVGVRYLSWVIALDCTNTAVSICVPNMLAQLIAIVGRVVFFSLFFVIFFGFVLSFPFDCFCVCWLLAVLVTLTTLVAPLHSRWQPFLSSARSSKPAGC